MNSDFARLMIQVALVVVPIALFAVLKSKVTTAAVRLGIALAFAFIGGAAAYYLAAEYAWRPIARGGKTVNLSPAVLFGAMFAVLFITMAVWSVAKPRAKTEKKG